MRNLLFVTTLFFGLSLFAKGGGIKIGYVDLQKAVIATKEGKKAKQKMEKIVKKKEEEMKKKLENFKKMEADLQKQMNLMTDQMKKQKLQEYQEKGMKLQQEYMNHQKEIAQLQQKLFAPILEKMNKIINDIGMSEGYTIILEKTADNILYAMPQLDLTAEVVKRYNSGK